MNRSDFKNISGRQTIEKTPSAVLDYVLNLTAWLDRTGSVLADEVNVTTEGLVAVISSSVIDSGKKISLWITGGVEGTLGSVAITFRTTDTPPRIDTRTMYFKVRRA